jgi:rubrerythrin
MTDSDHEARQMFALASMGHVAYHVWAEQARRERRFNIARLFDALSAARLARAGNAFRRLSWVCSTAENVTAAFAGAIIGDISADRITGVTPFARDLLARAQRAIGEGRDLRAGELGDLFVCATCGEICEGRLEGACRHCGAVPEAHKAFRAIESMGTLGSHAIMAFLEQTEEALRTLVAGLDDDLLARRLNEATPSLKELIGHLADMDAIFHQRAWLLLETNRPTLPPAHPPTLESAAVYRDQPVDAVLDAYHTTRTQTLSLLRGLTSAAWHREGYHEVYGVINLLHQANWLISHERAHLVEMAQIRHDLIAADRRYSETSVADIVVTGSNEGE